MFERCRFLFPFEYHRRSLKERSIKLSSTKQAIKSIENRLQNHDIGKRVWGSARRV